MLVVNIQRKTLKLSFLLAFLHSGLYSICVLLGQIISFLASRCIHDLLEMLWKINRPSIYSRLLSVNNLRKLIFPMICHYWKLKGGDAHLSGVLPRPNRGLEMAVAILKMKYHSIQVCASGFLFPCLCSSQLFQCMEKNQRNYLLNYFLVIFTERTENTHLLKQKMLLGNVGFDRLLCLRMFFECLSIKLFFYFLSIVHSQQLFTLLSV